MYICQKNKKKRFMNKQKHPHGYWTKERCYTDAMKYTSRNEVHVKNKAVYEAAWIHGLRFFKNWTSKVVKKNKR